MKVTNRCKAPDSVVEYSMAEQDKLNSLHPI